MTPQTTELIRARIIAKLEVGWSIRAVAREFHLNKNSVLKIKRRWEQEATLARRAIPGRPRITTIAEDNNIIRYLEQNPFKTSRDAIVETNFPGSQPTVCRRIKNSELFNYAAAKKIALSDEDKQSRLLYALNYSHRERHFWENVVFTDEKVFQNTNDGHVRVYRPQRTRFDERYVSETQRSGRFSVNVWGWFSFHGLGICWRIGDRFNSQNYLRICEYVMLPSVRQVYPENNFIYMQDNCSVHTANIIRQWFGNNNIETLPHPAKSPDLNPIENIWGLMVKKISKLNVRPRNADVLWEVIENAWEGLSENEDLVHNLVHSMPRRLNEVIARNGAMTKY